MPPPLKGEWDLIERLTRVFGSPPPEVVRGIGDDCAVLTIAAEPYLLWTIDTLIETVHFDLNYISLYQLGRKALAVNLSDIAAMGGEPRYALLSLGWPPSRELNGALEVAAGIQEMAQHYRVQFIGGDTVRSPTGLILSVTVIGNVNPGELLSRHGAQVGNLIYVTGPLGEAAAGLEVLRQGLDLPASEKIPLTKAFLDPQPQLEAARLLAQHHLATALIDLSDGVASDLYQICRQSEVGACLEVERIPISPEVRRVADRLGRDPLELALKGGEDYQLLFTLPPLQQLPMQECFHHAGLPVPIVIGQIVSGDKVLLITPQGTQDISGAGYDHFPAS